MNKVNKMALTTNEQTLLETFAQIEKDSGLDPQSKALYESLLIKQNEPDKTYLKGKELYALMYKNQEPIGVAENYNNYFDNLGIEPNTAIGDENLTKLMNYCTELMIVETVNRTAVLDKVLEHPKLTFAARTILNKLAKDFLTDGIVCQKRKDLKEYSKALTEMFPSCNKSLEDICEELKDDKYLNLHYQLAQLESGNFKSIVNYITKYKFHPIMVNAMLSLAKITSLFNAVELLITEDLPQTKQHLQILIENTQTSINDLVDWVKELDLPDANSHLVDPYEVPDIRVFLEQLFGK